MKASKPKERNTNDHNTWCYATMFAFCEQDAG